MTIREKINQKRGQIQDSLKGGWWLPNKDEKIEEWTENRTPEIANRFIKPVVILKVLVNDKQKEEYKKKNGDSYLLKYYDLDQMEEGLTVIQGNLKQQLAKLLLGIEDKKYNELTEDELGLISEKSQIFNQVSDLTKNYDKEVLTCMITYHGKTSFNEDDQKYHTYSVERLKFTKEELKVVFDNQEVPF